MRFLTRRSVHRCRGCSRRGCPRLQRSRSAAVASVAAVRKCGDLGVLGLPSAGPPPPGPPPPSALPSRFRPVSTGPRGSDALQAAVNAGLQFGSQLTTAVGGSAAASQKGFWCVWQASRVTIQPGEPEQTAPPPLPAYTRQARQTPASGQVPKRAIGGRIAERGSARGPWR
jgi:hypothetical protein